MTFTVHHDGVDIGLFFLQASGIIEENGAPCSTDIIRQEVARIILVETKDLIVDLAKRTKMRCTIIKGNQSGPGNANHPLPGPQNYIKLFWYTSTGKTLSVRRADDPAAAKCGQQDVGHDSSCASPYATIRRSLSVLPP